MPAMLVQEPRLAQRLACILYLTNLLLDGLGGRSVYCPMLARALLYSHSEPPAKPQLITGRECHKGEGVPVTIRERLERGSTRKLVFVVSASPVCA